jgi:hypothetical protein
MMGKTNDTSRCALLEDHRPLADSELDAVSGGAFPIVMAQIALLNSSQSGVDHQPLSISKVLDWSPNRDGGKVMSNTSDEVRELRGDELNEVAGGLVVNAIIAILLPLLLPDPPKKAG